MTKTKKVFLFSDRALPGTGLYFVSVSKTCSCLKTTSHWQCKQNGQLQHNCLSLCGFLPALPEVTLGPDELFWIELDPLEAPEFWVFIFCSETKPKTCFVALVNQTFKTTNIVLYNTCIMYMCVYSICLFDSAIVLQTEQIWMPTC